MSNVDNSFDFKEGDIRTWNYYINNETIDSFSMFSGDTAPLHSSEQFAKANGFEGRIVHGAALQAFASHFVGMILPGPGSLLQRWEMNFRIPCYAPAEILIQGKIRQISEATKTVVVEIGDSIADNHASAEFLMGNPNRAAVPNARKHILSVKV